jgi:hypothetical protein
LTRRTGNPNSSWVCSHALAISRRTARPSRAGIFRPNHKGAGNAGRSDAPAASRANEKKHASIVTTVTPISPGIPRAIGFNGFLRALPGEPGFFATIAREIIASQA